MLERCGGNENDRIIELSHKGTVHSMNEKCIIEIPKFSFLLCKIILHINRCSYGIMDASGMVKEAKGWTLVPEQKSSAVNADIGKRST